MAKSAWYKSLSTTLPELRAELAQAFPTLHLYEQGGLIELLGSLPIVHDGVEIDRFKIQILVPPDYPAEPPIVLETGGRIPRTIDRHIYPWGVCCLFYPDEYRLRYPNGLSLCEFIRGPVRDYFLGQLAVEIGQPWPFGQRAHGKPGGFEFYEEFLGVKGKDVVLNYLQCLSYDSLKGHQRCPCGSGRRLRDCHIADLAILREKFPRDIAKSAYKRLARD